MLNAPDIANTKPKLECPLDRAGMTEIEALVKVPAEAWGLHLDSRDAKDLILPAKVDVFVNLIDTKSRGIHMSRLYLIVTQLLETEVLSPALCEKILQELLRSHKGLSDTAYLEIRFDLPMRRKALISDNYGLRHYPIVLSMVGVIDEESRNFYAVQDIRVDITYSSTCPCSAALSRDLTQQAWLESFANRNDLKDLKEKVTDWLAKEESVAGTPHGQRSIAKVSVQCETSDWEIVPLINRIESALKTPVQAAVKREDEQEFARLNAENLMFSEDAARFIHQALAQVYSEFNVETIHLESLHPHNAVAAASYGGEDESHD